MAKDERNSQSNDSRETPRRAYVTPKLREFGPVGSLTQAGTGANFEMGGGMMGGISGIMRRP